MICKACGRNTENENANFCEYCGTSFRTNRFPEQEAFNSKANGEAVHQVNEGVSDKPISLGHWLGCMFMQYIPLVGPIIYFVMLMVWSFSNATPNTKKNWARASLIMLIVTFILLISSLTYVADILSESGILLNQYMGEYY